MACGGAEKVIVASAVEGVSGRRSGHDSERRVGVAGVIVLLGHVGDVVRARVEIEHCRHKGKIRRIMSIKQ